MPAPFVHAARVTLLAAIAAWSGPAEAEAQTALKWSPKKGETLKYVFTQANSAKTAEPGREPESSKSELTIDLTWKVDEVDAEGIIGLTQVVSRARSKVTSKGTVFEYDSKDSKADAGDPPVRKALATLYNAVVGQSYAIRLSPAGEVLDVKVPAAVTAAVADSPYAGMADSGGFLTPEGVKNMLAQLIPRLPAGPVERGATWAGEVVLPVGDFKTILKMSFKADSVAPTAAIEAKIETTIQPPPDPLFTIKINKQSGSLRCSFDPGAGRLVESTVHQSLEMTLGRSNYSAEQTTETTTTIRLAK